MKASIAYYLLCMIALMWFILWPVMSEMVLPHLLNVLAFFFGVSWFILAPIVLVNEIKWWNENELISIRVKIVAFSSVFLLPILVYFAMVFDPERFIPIISFLTFILTPSAGTILLKRANKKFKFVMITSLFLWIIVAPLGWLIAASSDEISPGVKAHAWVLQEANRCTTTALSRLPDPDRFAWNITHVSSVGSQRKATVQFYTWMRIPTYAITVPGCDRVQE